MHACYAEVGTIKQFQKYNEYLRRAGKTRKDVFQSVADLRNFQLEHQLPDTVDEFDPYSMYTPDIDWASYPGSWRFASFVRSMSNGLVSLSKPLFAGLCMAMGRTRYTLDAGF